MVRETIDIAMQRLSGYQFYNTSRFDLAELCNDSEQNKSEKVIKKIIAIIIFD
jgi:hypothetical protein